MDRVIGQFLNENREIVIGLCVVLIMFLCLYIRMLLKRASKKNTKTDQPAQRVIITPRIIYTPPPTKIYQSEEPEPKQEQAVFYRVPMPTRMQQSDSRDKVADALISWGISGKLAWILASTGMPALRLKSLSYDELIAIDGIFNEDAAEIVNKTLGIDWRIPKKGPRRIPKQLPNMWELPLEKSDLDNITLTQWYIIHWEVDIQLAEFLGILRIFPGILIDMSAGEFKEFRKDCKQDGVEAESINYIQEIIRRTQKRR